MYLSCLLIDTGNNPDRPRPARDWLRNLYRVHQRLSMAFPSGQSKIGDPHFLQPYDPADFTQAIDGKSNATRSTERGFLFRIDHRSDGPAVILVQSAIAPDWGYAFHNAEFLAAEPQVKPFNPQFEPGAQLRFRLLANPTKKVEAALKSERMDRNRTEPLTRKQLDGRRQPVHDLEAWLTEWPRKKGKSSGFRLLQIDSLVPGYVLAHKGKDNPKGAGARLRSVRYEGILTVEDPEVFRQTIIHGIGPAKAFGFGLLSVIPLPSSGQP